MFDPFEQDIEALGAALAAGHLTSARLVDYYLARIAAYDRAGPSLNAMVALDPGAREAAARLDAERAQGRVRGPLHGLPMVVKDNIDVAGLPTTAGSATLRGHVPARDAYVVARLRQAGAIVLGKTNMSEFACSNGRYGYGSLVGLTLNPYNPGRNAAGSSSGTAAAVAANFAVFGLGTDSFGSIRAPACVTGLVGVRPTLGLTSRTGVLPLASTFDVTGPLTRGVRDAAIVLHAMADVPDGADPASAALRGAENYRASLHDATLRGARIGVAEDFPGENDDVRRIAADAAATMARHGATLVPLRLPPPAATVHADLLGPLADAELAPELAAYLARTPGPWPATLEQVIDAAAAPAIAASATPMNPRTLAALRQFLARAHAQTPAQRVALRRDLSAFRAALDSLMRERGLAALVFPTLSCPASPRYDRDDPLYVCSARNPYDALYVASAAAWPEVTVPAGMAAGGVPVGMSFMGPAYGERNLLRLACAFERAAAPRVPPPLA